MITDRLDRSTLRRAISDAQLEIALRSLTVGTKASPISPQIFAEVREVLLDIRDADVLSPQLQRRLLDAIRIIGGPPDEDETFTKIFSRAFRPATKGRSPPRRRSKPSAVRYGEDWRVARPRIDSRRTWGSEQLAEASKSRNFVQQLEELVAKGRRRH